MKEYKVQNSQLIDGACFQALTCCKEFNLNHPTARKPRNSISKQLQAFSFEPTESKDLTFKQQRQVLLAKKQDFKHSLSFRFLGWCPACKQKLSVEDIVCAWSSVPTQFLISCPLIICKK